MKSIVAWHCLEAAALLYTMLSRIVVAHLTRGLARTVVLRAKEEPVGSDVRSIENESICLAVLSTLLSALELVTFSGKSNSPPISSPFKFKSRPTD
jgi:hypothetical protein